MYGEEPESIWSTSRSINNGLESVEFTQFSAKVLKSKRVCERVFVVIEFQPSENVCHCETLSVVKELTCGVLSTSVAFVFPQVVGWL